MDKNKFFWMQHSLADLPAMDVALSVAMLVWPLRSAVRMPHSSALLMEPEQLTLMHWAGEVLVGGVKTPAPTIVRFPAF